jgi:hypothetical protein
VPVFPAECRIVKERASWPGRQARSAAGSGAGQGSVSSACPDGRRPARPETATLERRARHGRFGCLPGREGSGNRHRHRRGIVHRSHGLEPSPIPAPNLSPLLQDRANVVHYAKPKTPGRTRNRPFSVSPLLEWGSRGRGCNSRRPDCEGPLTAIVRGSFPLLGRALTANASKAVDSLVILFIVSYNIAA